MSGQGVHGRCAILAGLLILGMGTHGPAQFGPAVPTGGQDGNAPPAMIVPPGRETLQALTLAKDAMRQGRTADAVQLLQRLIDLPEDYFTDKSMQQTLKSETLQILAGLTRNERDAYELLQGATARAALAEARSTGDADKLALVARRYPWTQASRNAIELLALDALDHGRAWQAASQWAQLRTSPVLSEFQARQLGVREAMAWHQAGQPERAAKLLSELTQQDPPLEVEIAGEKLPRFQEVADAEKWLTRIAGPSSRHAESALVDWTSLRGSAVGSAPAIESGPIGGPIWQLSHLSGLEADLPKVAGYEPGTRLLQQLRVAESTLMDTERFAWPAAAPLVIGKVVIFRTARDILAIDRHTGEIRWRSVLTDPDFDQLWSAPPPPNNQPPNQQPNTLLAYLRSRLLEDRTFGTLSSDGQLVFAVDGLGFQPGMVVNQANGIRIMNPNGQALPEATNRLTAYEVQGGRLAWEIGGNRAESAGEFAGHFFLGAPLSAEGKLFALAEFQGEMRLLALETTSQGLRRVWTQPLVAPVLKISMHDERRRLGLTPAVSNGIIVCPTETGAVVAVDFSLRRLVWAYQYPSSLSGLQNLNGNIFMARNMMAQQAVNEQGWIDGTPVIADGRVLITPTDSDELHCLNLADGKLLWKIPRERAVFLAGADHRRAVLVGPDRVDAVQVTDGAPAWNDAVHIPTPTGRGVWMKDRYLIPLSSGEIGTIHLAEGRMLARSKLPDRRIPGHLAAGQGGLVSVSNREAIGFRSLIETEQRVSTELAADARNAKALAARGELRLHRGELAEGLKDLRASIAIQSEPYVKSVLASALLVGLRSDFSKYRETIAELEALADDPQQRNEFVWLVARGLQDAGEPLAAFERMTYLIDGALDEFSVEGVDNPWQARNDRRLTGLFSALYRSASPEERKKLDEQIQRRMPTGPDKSDAELAAAWRRYLRAFGFHQSAAAARQQLVSKLNPDQDTLEYVQELLRLTRIDDASISAPAAATLARWSLARKRFEDVAGWITQLDSRWADAACEPGLTGKQLAEQLRTQEDVVAHHKTPLPWPEGQVEQKRSNQANQNGRMVRTQIVGQVPVQFLGWSFETDPAGTMLIARDQFSQFRWRLNRPAPRNNEQQVFGEVPAGYHQVHLYQHYIGWSAGTQIIIAADLEPERATPRLLWHESLVPPGVNPMMMVNRMMAGRPRIAGVRRVAPLNQPGWMSGGGLGALVAITDSAVIWHNGRKLFASDPRTGQLLWSRKDVPRSGFEVQADDDTITIMDLAQNPQGGPTILNLLRTVDGEHRKLTAPVPGVLEWIGGRRVLVTEDPTRPQAGPLPLALVDVVQGEPIWKVDLARPAAVRVWNDAEVWTLEENRRLTVRHLHDGSVRWTQELKLENGAEALFVQRWQDRYLVVVGSISSPAPQPGSARVVGFDAQHTPINGYVLALKPDTGEVLWQTLINETLADPTGYDPTQPAGWPVLMFAGRMFVTPQPNNAAPVTPRLTATMIDKQTGKRIYSVEEPSNIGMYFVEADPDRNRWTANFMVWSVDLHYTGKPRK